jgi:hypothetical protein
VIVPFFNTGIKIVEKITVFAGIADCCFDGIYYNYHYIKKQQMFKK